MPHPLKGLYLLRYGSDVPGVDHTRSLLDPPEHVCFEDTAEQKQNFVHHSLDKLQKFSPIDRSKFTVDEVFAQNYISARRDTEVALRRALPDKGITPENLHALYFFLHNEINPDPPLMPGKKVVIALPAENIPQHLVSFTADDSFHFLDTSDRLPDQDRGKILNCKEMAQRLKEKGWLPSTPEKPRFFEAQLWSRRIPDFTLLNSASPSSDATNSAIVMPQQQPQARHIAQDTLFRTQEFPVAPRLPSTRCSDAPTFKPA